MKEHCDEIRKELEEKLAVIGWSLKHHGCEHYMLYNDKDRITAFAYRSGEIRLEDKSNNFGGEYKGTLFIDLKMCNIEVVNSNTKERPFLCIRSKRDKGKQSAIFLSFYNLGDDE